MAWAIFYGKDVENRNWSSKFRGRVMIHASRRFDRDHYLWLIANENHLDIIVPKLPDFIFGALLGEVDIVDCVKNHGSRWFFGPYGFVLKRPVLYENTIPCKGKLGFFEPGIH